MTTAETPEKTAADIGRAVLSCGYPVGSAWDDFLWSGRAYSATQSFNA